MGRDKATLPVNPGTIDGERWVDHAVRRLADVVDTVALADRGRHLVDGLPSVDDGPGRGPAAGILGAASAFPGRPLLVLACDMLRVPEALLTTLVQTPGDVVIPRHAKGVEPLCALYRPPALERLAQRVATGQWSLHPLIDESTLTVQCFEEDALRALGDPETLFSNLNTPEELARDAVLRLRIDNR